MIEAVPANCGLTSRCSGRRYASSEIGAIWKPKICQTAFPIYEDGVAERQDVRPVAVHSAVWRNEILHIDQRYAWVAARFADEPTWETRLRTWIAAHASAEQRICANEHLDEHGT